MAYKLNEIARQEDKEKFLDGLYTSTDQKEYKVIIIGDINGQVWKYILRRKYIKYLVKYLIEMNKLLLIIFSLITSCGIKLRI